MTASQPDLLDLLAEMDRPPYAGAAPLHFTSAYFHPDELLAASAEASRLEPIDWKARRHFYTWELGITTGWANTETAGHTLVLLDVDLRCGGFEHRDAGGCCCVGELLHQANCPDCRWQAFGTENAVVEAWHDHAWPGWRDLYVVLDAERPAVEAKQKAIDTFTAWLTELTPAEFRLPGAPMVTERTRSGNRHVPQRSPWNGYDMASPTQMRWFPPVRQLERAA
jgi:hypothetical protein